MTSDNTPTLNEPREEITAGIKGAAPRHTADTINDNDLDRLYDALARVRDDRHRYHQSLQQQTSRNHQLATAVARVRALHHPEGVVAAAEHGNPPDCAVCGSFCWPCPTINALDQP